MWSKSYIMGSFLYITPNLQTMRAIIIEDESLATQELIASLETVAPDIEIVATARSIAQAIEVIEDVEHDILFMDIELGDGRSFEIFNSVEVEVPVIYITAYDSYPLEAFKHHGVAYLLKPFGLDDLKVAIDKLALFRSKSIKEKFQKRFLIKVGNQVKSIRTKEIAYFMADGKYLYLRTVQNDQYLVDNTISNLISILNPTKFFQINRKFIINFNSIAKMGRHTNGRIKITLKQPPTDDVDVVVSADRVVAFKKWLNK